MIFEFEIEKFNCLLLLEFDSLQDSGPEFQAPFGFRSFRIQILESEIHSEIYSENYGWRWNRADSG